MNNRSYKNTVAVALTAIAVTLSSIQPAKAGAVRSGYDTTSLPRGDDNSSSSAVSLGFDAAINFFGSSTSTVYVNNNGNATFAGSLSEFTPNPLGSIATPLIAAFWGDVDTSHTSSGQTKYGTATRNGHKEFGITWPSVGYFQSQYNKLNVFQLILTERTDTGATNFDIEFNYDQVQWETGSWYTSGGTDGLGGKSARIGWSNGAGSSFELPGSGINGAFLDSGPSVTSLISNSLNSGVNGRYLFEVRNNNPMFFWKGQDASTSWGAQNWASDGIGTSTTNIPASTDDVTFSATGATDQNSTTLTSAFTIHSLTVIGTAGMTVSGAYNLILDDDGTLITGHNGIYIASTSAPVTINTNVVLGTGSEINVQGSAVLNITGDIAGPILTKLGPGTLDLTGAVLEAGMRLDVRGGTVILNESQSLGATTIASGCKLVFGPNSANVHVLDLASLTIKGDGQLDLTNNAMVVRDGDLTALTALLKTGINLDNDGWWDGYGINSSVAAGTSETYLRGLGIIPNVFESSAIYETFNGVTVGTSDVLIGYTYEGDADLDGSISGTDQWLLDNNAANDFILTGWLNGDFDYDGTFSAVDQWLVDQAVQNGGGG